MALALEGDRFEVLMDTQHQTIALHEKKTWLVIEISEPQAVTEAKGSVGCCPAWGGARQSGEWVDRD
jgi:hypothetical protein